MRPDSSIRITQSSATSRIASLRAWLFLASVSACWRVRTSCSSAAVRSAVSRSSTMLRRHGDDEEDVLEDDPRRVLQPAPLAGDQHAVHRLRPEDPAQHVIQRDDDGRRNQHAPVAIEREKRERAEHVEVRFDAAAGEMDQQRAHQHLRRRNRVARGRQARPQQRQGAPETD